jgi:hypothetical protein
VPRPAVGFPQVPSMPFAEYLPPVWRMDFGGDFGTTRLIAREPPTIGPPYPVLVPQVNADGNDVGGIPLPEVAVPLGTHTGWNVAVPPLPGLRYLAGLVGSFVPFTRTREARVAAGDERRAIAERYASRQEYLGQVDRAARTLVEQRLLLDGDVAAVRERAAAVWKVVVER